MAKQFTFLVRSEIAQFCFPGTVEKWPIIMQIDDGPSIIDRPKHWKLTHEEEKYVVFQCVLANGNHEYLHIPMSMAGNVNVYSSVLPVENISSTRLGDMVT